MSYQPSVPKIKIIKVQNAANAKVNVYTDSHELIASNVSSGYVAPAACILRIYDAVTPIPCIYARHSTDIGEVCSPSKQITVFPTVDPPTATAVGVVPYPMQPWEVQINAEGITSASATIEFSTPYNI